MSLRWLGWSLLLLVPTGAAAQVFFANVADGSGILEYRMPDGMTGGLAAADYDDDGDIDVFVPTGAGAADQLYRNLGNGRFEEIADAVGLGSSLRARGALWFDYDADSRLDLLVTGDCLSIACTGGVSLLRLYRQTESGSFVDVTTAAGLFEPATDHLDSEHRGGASVADIDNNGYPDLVVGMWIAFPRVFLNQGGTFTDVTSTCGLGGGAAVGHWQPLLHDFTGDGRPDLFWAIDFHDNQLWINQGPSPSAELSFVDRAADAGVDRAWNEMGATIGDYDNDGDGDLYVTNIYRVWEGDQRHNTLYRNDSSGATPSFTEIGQPVGVANGGWGWGTTFFDADNDGWLDLAETNGIFVEGYTTPMRLYMNQGGPQPIFEDIAAEAGLYDLRWGSALVAFDYDRDGDLDLLQTVADGSLALYQNQLAAGPGRHYLVIRPRMAGPNTHAIGARVTATIGATTQTRWITAGTSMAAQEPAEAFFGLGSASIVDRVTVYWPGGGESVWLDVAADQVKTVVDDRLFADGFEPGNASRWSASRP